MRSANASKFESGSSMIGGGAAALYGLYGRGGTRDSCYAAAAYALAAGLKTTAYVMDCNSRDKTCNEIPKFVGGANVSMKPSKSAELGGGGLGGGTGSGGGGGTNGGGGGSGTPTVPEDTNLDAPDSPYASAAMDGPMGDLFKTLPKDIATKGKEALGMSANDLAKRLASGEGMGAIIASQIGNMPPEAAEALKKIDEDAKSGRFAFKGQDSMPLAGGGGKGHPTSGTQPAPLFGFGSKAPATTTEAATFDKKQAILKEGDIWHEGYGGSIFQIVSTKLTQVKDRVERVEWDSPLNRALMGLPPRKR